MDGIHDLGGKLGYGSVLSSAQDAPVGEKLPTPAGAGFKQRWHASVFACMRATGAAGITKNTDHFRHAVERIRPAAYLTHGYYGRWLGGLENLLAEADVVSTAELDERTKYQSRSAANPRSAPDQFTVHSDVPDSQRGSSQRQVGIQPKFVPGDQVKTMELPVNGHTRLPAYARNKKGSVIACHDGWVFPDTNAHGRGECPQHLYTVAFANAELWGDAGEAGVVVHLDLFEEYLLADG